MYFLNLKYLLAAIQLKPADLARSAEVSRAAVSRWFREGERTSFVNVETRTLLTLAQNLGVKPEFFFIKLPDLDDETVLFLWDYLYPDMGTFISALLRHNPPALARLVQVLGLHEAQAILGKTVIRDFSSYKKYLHPARARQLEAIWHLYR